MTGAADAERVVVAVSPQLLSDAVRRTLELDGIATAEADGGAALHDVALVTAGRESDVRARTVITLRGDAGGVSGVVDLTGLRAAVAGAPVGPRRHG